ncbi:uncharacterized protein LOC141905505 [Tubulanus polymorphus]|uniref:uncharacterized protein LOC141905505 n=1 Tax=Tubulanus polymorphus TaxID=672921 RepID=UPI003DA566B9
MIAPSFRCNQQNDGSLVLHYYSDRRGLHPIVVGLVRTTAKYFFHTDVTVKVIANNNDVSDHVIFSVTPEPGFKIDRKVIPTQLVVGDPTNLLNRNHSLELPKATNMQRVLVKRNYSQDPQELPLSVETFCRTFPFHVMFDRGLVIQQAGTALLRVMKNFRIKRRHLLFLDLFRVIRPVLEFSFSTLVEHANTVFVVTTNPGVIGPIGEIGEINDLNENDLSMRLKGQMMYVPEVDMILFLCSPRVANLDDLKGRGLYLSDIPLHDATRDLILITQARRAERELVEKLEETSNNLKMLQARLQEDKQRTDELLLSILPADVAEKLRLNESVEAEQYETVTILFSDVVEFTALCGNEKVTAMDIVRLLNRLYTQFDILCSMTDVYKMETIGDAYMVVGGLPEQEPTHADRVVNMALAMIESSKSIVFPPIDNKQIQIRIGIHSGPVMAGVVGQKMPRYCLFGRTVTLANKMESCSLPGRVNISDEAKQHITQPMHYVFEENNTRPDLPCSCFFISYQPNSPCHLSPVELNLSLPLGLFRTPCPSPSASPTVDLSPSSELSAASSLRNSPKINSPTFQMPTIKISSIDEGSESVSVVGDKIQHYTLVDERLKDALVDSNSDTEEPPKCPFNRFSRRRRSYAGRSTSPTEFLFRREERAKLVSNCDIVVGTTSKPHLTSGRFDPHLARVLHEKLAEYAEDVNNKREERWNAIHNWEDTTDILQILEQEKPTNNPKRSEILDFAQTTSLTCPRVMSRRRGSLASVREVSEQSMNYEISKFRRSRLQPSRRNVSPSSSIPENLTVDDVSRSSPDDSVFSGEESFDPVNNVTPDEIIATPEKSYDGSEGSCCLTLNLNTILKNNKSNIHDSLPPTHDARTNCIKDEDYAERQSSDTCVKAADNQILNRTSISPSKCERLVRNLQPPTFKVMPNVKNSRLDNHIEIHSGISDGKDSDRTPSPCRVCKNVNDQSPQTGRKSRSSLSPVLPNAEECKCYPSCCCDFSHFEQKQLSELMRSVKSTPNSRSHSPQPKPRRTSLDSPCDSTNASHSGMSTSSSTALGLPQKSSSLSKTDSDIEKIRKRSRDMNGNRSRTRVPDRNVITTVDGAAALDESQS